ncbi:MAG: hypothetical protein AB1762_16910 [Gemmatimonadota bacterium]
MAASNSLSSFGAHVERWHERRPGSTSGERQGGERRTWKGCLTKRDVHPRRPVASTSPAAPNTQESNMYRRITGTLMAALLVTAFAAAGAQAQQTKTGQQQAKQQAQQQQTQQQQLQQQQQQRLQQMEQALQKTERIRERLRLLEQEMTRDMERDRTRDQQHLREHQRLRDMNKALGEMAQQLHGATLQLRDRERDQDRVRDQEMERDMERLRLHVDQMGQQLDEGLKIMERIQARLRVLQPAK